MPVNHNKCTLINKVITILSERYWNDHQPNEKKKLLQLLVIWSIIGLFAVFFFLKGLLFNYAGTCIICYITWLLLVALPVFCILNGRIHCTLNVVFGLPLVLYSFYFSDFNPVPTISNSVYITVIWLTFGLVFLLLYSDSEHRIRAFYLVSIITIVVQLFKIGHLADSLTYFKPLSIHPIIIFTLIFILTYALRIYFIFIIKNHESEITAIKTGITRVFQDSNFSIVQIRAERDEAGNIMDLIIERVNNTFESTFKINLYEVQEQKAGYILDLVLKDKFDLNRIILGTGKNRRINEFHAVRLEKWFEIQTLKPNYHTFYLILEDITRTKIKIADLEESRRRYKILLEAIPDMFFVIDKDGTYEDFVMKESELFKIEDANIIGSTIYEVGFPENMAAKIYSCIQNSIKTNSVESIEYSLNTPNGTFMYEMRIARLNTHSVISVARDITKRKTAEFKLEKALVKAEEPDRLKSAFLANLSHEIKTPMNVITNFSRVLAESDLDSEEKLELTDAISMNGKQLLNMIDNTIHLSKIETQTVEMNPRFCPVNVLVRNIYNKYFVLVPDSKNVKLKHQLDVPNIEFGFETDPEILSEILSLLVDNAIKYTMKGEIILKYEMVLNECVKFSVSDTGIGIPDNERENIFGRFYRVKNDINATTSGSGLGLAIVQHYAAMLGGELEFESTSDKGTKFWFALPFKNGKGYLRVVV